MDPDPLPYQDILDARDNSQQIKGDNSTLQNQNPTMINHQPGSQSSANTQISPEPTNPVKRLAQNPRVSTNASSPLEPTSPVKQLVKTPNYQPIHQIRRNQRVQSKGRYKIPNCLPVHQVHRNQQTQSNG